MKIRNAKKKSTVVKSTVPLIFLILAVLLIIPAPVQAVPKNLSVRTLNSFSLTHSQKAQESSIQSELLRLAVFWQLPLLSPVLAQGSDVVEDMPGGDQLNDFMITAFSWGIETGFKFLSLLLALKVVSSVFKK